MVAEVERRPDRLARVHPGEIDAGTAHVTPR